MGEQGVSTLTTLDTNVARTSGWEVGPVVPPAPSAALPALLRGQGALWGGRTAVSQLVFPGL